MYYFVPGFLSLKITDIFSTSVNTELPHSFPQGVCHVQLLGSPTFSLPSSLPPSLLPFPKHCPTNTRLSPFCSLCKHPYSTINILARASLCADGSTYKCRGEGFATPGLVWGHQRLRKVWDAGPRWLFLQTSSRRRDGRGCSLYLMVCCIWPSSWTAPGSIAIWAGWSEQPCGSPVGPAYKPCASLFLFLLFWRGFGLTDPDTRYLKDSSPLY